MLTNFGKYLRKLRIDCGELIRDMANKLDVTASYLSAVETGKRNIPATWAEDIAYLYNLNAEAKEELNQAALSSAKAIKLDLGQASASGKETALLFAREFNELDDTTLLQIRDLLQKP